MTTFVLHSVAPLAPAALLADVISAALAGMPELVAAYAPLAAAHGRPPITMPSFRIASSATDFAAGEVPVLFAPTMPGSVGSSFGIVAFHWLRNGLPYGFVLADTTDAAEVRDRALHEIVEATVDPDCDWYINGRAVEPCDAGEGVALTRGGMRFPAWVTPAWLGVGPGVCLVRDAGPDLAPGEVSERGYAMLEDGSEVTADGYRHPDRKCHPHSRRMRRRHRMGFSLFDLASVVRPVMSTSAPGMAPDIGPGMGQARDASLDAEALATTNVVAI